MKSSVLAVMACVAAADDSTSMLQTGSHQALLDRASQSTINNVIAEFLSLPVERRQALLKLADTNKPDAVLANWLSLPVQQRNELIELARSGSVEGSTQMKGKKKKKDEDTCTDQLNDKVDSDAKKAIFCKKADFFKHDGTTDAKAVLVAGDKFQQILDDEEDLDECDGVKDVFDWCMEPCFEALDDFYENHPGNANDKEEFCRIQFFSGNNNQNNANLFPDNWQLAQTYVNNAQSLVDKVCPPDGSQGQMVAFTTWCDIAEDE